MSENVVTESRKTDDCLELRFEAIIRAVFSNAGAIVSCLAFAIGALAVRWTFGFHLLTPWGYSFKAQESASLSNVPIGLSLIHI